MGSFLFGIQGFGLYDHDFLCEFIRHGLTETNRTDAAVQIGCSGITCKKIVRLIGKNMGGIRHLGNKREGGFFFDCS